MYTVSENNIHQILTYSDVYNDKIPDLKNEIALLNIHKSISIISELIRVRNILLNDIPVLGGIFSLPFELILKKWFGIIPQSSEDLKRNPLFRKNVHIISVQMLLLLLKKIIQYGDIDTINNIDYSITEEDYKKIIQLQLIVAEELDKKHSKKTDVNHFLYSTYHFNSNKNVAHEFLRMYYMLERLSQNRTAFDDDVQNEYKDYYTDFSNKYGFTPTQYSSLLFGELNMYYSEIRGLTKSSIWRDTNDIYEKKSKRYHTFCY